MGYRIVAVSPLVPSDERHQKHFNSSCRLKGCDNPHGLPSREALGSRKVRRWPQVFCRLHRHLRHQITLDGYRKLCGDTKFRLELLTA